jgi:predicted TIM-barrel fold metal-dependent hydrolase
MPNDGGLIDQLCDWVTDPNIQQQILVSNPEQLYGFV